MEDDRIFQVFDRRHRCLYGGPFQELNIFFKNNIRQYNIFSGKEAVYLNMPVAQHISM